jgi:hypothetical protein
MSDCYNCDEWERKYDNLRWKYDKLSDKYDDLQRKYDKAYDELSSAEHRIRYELEPRIESEHRSYDSYVTSGGSDECFRNGMSGNCGIHCSIFGDKPECFDGFNKEKIIDAYIEHGRMDGLDKLIEEYGLVEECKEIDREYYREQIDIHNRAIEKLQIELNKI